MCRYNTCTEIGTDTCCVHADTHTLISSTPNILEDVTIAQMEQNLEAAKLRLIGTQNTLHR